MSQNLFIIVQASPPLSAKKQNVYSSGRICKITKHARARGFWKDSRKMRENTPIYPNVLIFRQKSARQYRTNRNGIFTPPFLSRTLSTSVPNFVHICPELCTHTCPELCPHTAGAENPESLVNKAFFAFQNRFLSGIFKKP